MGVFVVEKHVFYLEWLTQKVKPVQMKDYTRVQLALRHKRMFWEGTGDARSIVLLHSSEIGGDLEKHISGDISVMRKLLLGKLLPGQPKLIVADVPFERLLMTKQEMGKFLLNMYARGRRENWLEQNPIHIPQDNLRDVWTYFDPTHPGQHFPGQKVWYEQAKKVFDKKFSREFFIRKEGKLVPNHEVIVPIGLAYRTRFFTTVEPRPPNLRWPPRIQSRVKPYLTQQMPHSEYTGQWYVLGKVELPDLLQDAPSRRSEFVKTYQGAKLVDLPKKDNTPKRRLFIVTGKNQEEARKAAEVYIAKLIQHPNEKTKLRGYILANAWERGGHEVISRQSWHTTRDAYLRLKEEFY